MSDAGISRDKAFAKRLEQACANHPRAPSGHGQQTWVRKALEERFNVTLSPEAIRKWFAGEARPRTTTMMQLAEVLGVDEAWLALGISPAAEPRAKAKLNALASGAVNLVAGHIQLAGGTIAYPEKDAGFDLFAIIEGRQIAIEVKLASQDPQSRISFASTDKTAIAVVPTERSTLYRYFRIQSELLNAHGNNRGGYTDISLEFDPKFGAAIAGNPIPEIENFARIEGNLRTAAKTKNGIRAGTA